MACANVGPIVKYKGGDAETGFATNWLGARIMLTCFVGRHWLRLSERICAGSSYFLLALNAYSCLAPAAILPRGQAAPLKLDKGGEIAVGPRATLLRRSGTCGCRRRVCLQPLKESTASRVGLSSVLAEAAEERCLKVVAAPAGPGYSRRRSRPVGDGRLLGLFFRLALAAALRSVEGASNDDSHPIWRGAGSP